MSGWTLPTETSIGCFADKLLCGQSEVSIRARFTAWIYAERRRRQARSPAPTRTRWEPRLRRLRREPARSSSPQFWACDGCRAARSRPACDAWLSHEHDRESGERGRHHERHHDKDHPRANRLRALCAPRSAQPVRRWLALVSMSATAPHRGLSGSAVMDVTGSIGEAAAPRQAPTRRDHSNARSIDAVREPGPAPHRPAPARKEARTTSRRGPVERCARFPESSLDVSEPLPAVPGAES